MKRIILVAALLPSVLYAQKDSTRGKESVIEEVVFQVKRKPVVSDVTATSISAKQAQAVASLSGGIEDLLKTLPYVNSNTELSSQQVFY
ncbi:MAG: TonB-dependent receptor, partial [Chryseobacterium sp.]